MQQFWRSDKSQHRLNWSSGISKRITNQEGSFVSEKVKSKDGTLIAYEKSGHGPAVVIVGGVVGDRSQQAPVAEILANDFTVFNFDRRGHGESGDTPPYSIEREIEDIDAVIAAAGGSAFVYGTSGPGVLALLAAAGKAGARMKKLAIWEPPFIVDGSRPKVRSDYKEELNSLLSQGRRGDMVALFFTEAVGIPAQFVEQMRQAPWWSAQEALAHTTVYDATLMGDYSLPGAVVARINVPTLVIDGGQSPWLIKAADAVASAVPSARRQTLAGQQHNVDPAAIAPALAEFFKK
jgi:pimeloyl-ACP methyl ester carboxylesterase